VVGDVLTHLFIIYPIFFYPENTCTRTNNNNHNDNEKNAKIEEKGKSRFETMGESETILSSECSRYILLNTSLLYYAYPVVLHIYDKCSLGYKPFG